jgi:hypothetical protein
MTLLAVLPKSRTDNLKGRGATLTFKQSSAYHYARRLKTLKGLTPYEYICKCWTSQPERFKLSPLQQMPGLNTLDFKPLFAQRRVGQQLGWSSFEDD